jgi:ribosomal-protein-alanine N-acetyltransferase
MAFPPKRWSTHRLQARPAVVDDATAVFDAWAGDPEATRWLGFPTARRAGETAVFLRRAERAWQTGHGHRTWLLFRRDDRTLVGAIGVTPNGHSASVGYVIARPFWGQGYATEALVAMCDAALAEPRIFRVWAWCDVANRASARVLEKAGMRREGRLRRFAMHPNTDAEPRDVWCYARVR